MDPDHGDHPDDPDDPDPTEAAADTPVSPITSDSSDPGQPEFRSERWVYLGLRQGRGAKTYYAWRDEAGDELDYDKLKARVFGGIHTVQVRRVEDRITALAGSVQFTGDRAEDAAVIEVRALQTEHEVAVMRLERNAKRTHTLDEALIPVLEIAKGLKAYSDRRALLDYISSKVHSV